ncbi:hypothetical protein WR25_03168 [Diploscapter pachys]|uniref:Uncharacterized protein n=1 Tax=Diploscapter pachys TaxID=2018661 RepID=A0A2A2KL61_9BILA|nr:hypothetical protein WR25_03168 [Diploscapter pachys]
MLVHHAVDQRPWEHLDAVVEALHLAVENHDGRADVLLLLGNFTHEVVHQLRGLELGVGLEGHAQPTEQRTGGALRFGQGLAVRFHRQFGNGAAQAGDPGQHALLMIAVQTSLLLQRIEDLGLLPLISQHIGPGAFDAVMVTDDAVVQADDDQRYADQCGQQDKGEKIEIVVVLLGQCVHGVEQYGELRQVHAVLDQQAEIARAGQLASQLEAKRVVVAAQAQMPVLRELQICGFGR